jgi:hypothetical protein
VPKNLQRLSWQVATQQTLPARIIAEVEVNPLAADQPMRVPRMAQDDRDAEVTETEETDSKHHSSGSKAKRPPWRDMSMTLPVKGCQTSLSRWQILLDEHISSTWRT